MNKYSHEVIKVNVMKTEELDKKKEYKIELEQLFAFSEETRVEYCLPEDKRCFTHCIGTLKWNVSQKHWQLIDITIIDCHAASINKVYGFGEVIDLEDLPKACVDDGFP